MPSSAALRTPFSRYSSSGEVQFANSLNFPYAYRTRQMAGER